MLVAGQEFVEVLQSLGVLSPLWVTPPLRLGQAPCLRGVYLWRTGKLLLELEIELGQTMRPLLDPRVTRWKSFSAKHDFLTQTLGLATMQIAQSLIQIHEKYKPTHLVKCRDRCHSSSRCREQSVARALCGFPSAAPEGHGQETGEKEFYRCSATSLLKIGGYCHPLGD